MVRHHLDFKKFNRTVGGLEVLYLYKSYGQRSVVANVSLYVERGEVVHLLGPCKSGKTTTLAIIAGLISADSGHVYLNEKDISYLPVYYRSRLGIRYLPKESSIFRGLTVEQSIKVVLELYAVDEAKLSIRLDSLLDEFSIGHLRLLPSISISEGERKRVEFACVLASNPEFVMLDEPFDSVSPDIVKSTCNLVVNLKNRGVGVLISDCEVRKGTLCFVDRTYFLSRGSCLPLENYELENYESYHKL